ncbi:MAG: PAS domain S-box protein [Candidatus Delongbacteria bacterium]|nr:PAS domain S-box protein [Candidatus Delongbacteria bacterium]MBN2835089.1 PAS domain S-box protein [Candidatus Delongbacteria bacterium]
MSIIFEIIYNFSLIFSVSIICQHITSKNLPEKYRKLVQGVLFSFVTIIGMLNPVILKEGLVFDGRSVIISLVSMFYGGIPALITFLSATLFRYSQGGIGLYMGYFVIFESALVGYIFHYIINLKRIKISIKLLLLNQVIVHTLMLFSVYFLPSSQIFHTINSLWLIILILYPVFGFLLGYFFLKIDDYKLIKLENHNYNNRFELLVKNSFDIIVIVDAEGKQRYVSPSCKEITGYMSSELEGKPITDIIHPDDFPEIQKSWDLILKDKTLVKKGRYRHKHKTKGWVYMEAVAQNFFDEPTISGIVCSVRDISEGIIIEDELRRSEQNFRHLLELAPDAFFQGNTRGDIITCNNNAIVMTGYSREDLIGKNLSFLFTEKILTKKPLDYEALNRGETIKTEREIRRKNGSVYPVEMSSKKMPNGTYQSFMRDITERKEAEYTLINEKERLLVTLKSIGDGVIVVDKQGKITLMNREAEKLTGWSNSEAFGKDIEDVFIILNEISGSIIENPVKKVFLTGKIHDLENHTLLKSRTGREMIIADSASPIMDQSGNIIGVVLVFRDVTEKEKLIREVQQAQKLESIGVLAGGIAHDFNNLLAGIYGYITIAIMKSKDNDVTTTLRKAENSIQRAKHLTLQLLTFSKGGDPIINSVEMKSFIQEITKFALSGSHVSINFDLCNTELYAYIDKNQIAQALDNIIINSKEAMPAGGEIEVKLRVTERSILKHPDLNYEKYILISITDQGTGIPKDYIDKIFDPFFTTKPEGHGLGLAMSYSIIQKHEGFIEVESKIGKGTTFEIYLPIRTNMNRILDNKNSNDAVQSEKRSRKILVMDDEPILREIIKDFLLALGHNPTVCKNGNEAVDLFKNSLKSDEKYEVVIFDLTIPGAMGGIDAFKIIKEMDNKVIGLVSSGYSKDQAISTPIEFGFAASIVKPFTIEELDEVLSKIL